MNEKETLSLPSGYGEGTVIYDKSGEPWRATKKMIEGIYEIEKIDKNVADAIPDNFKLKSK